MSFAWVDPRLMGLGQSRTKDFNQERRTSAFADVAGEDRRPLRNLKEVRGFLMPEVP